MQNELVLERCPAPQVIAVSVGTVRADAWVRQCRCYFDDLHYASLTGCFPKRGSAVVSACYDFEEVLTYIASPEWARIDVAPLSWRFPLMVDL